MSRENIQRDLSYIVLCVSLVVVFVLFGVRANYSPGVYYAIAGVQISVFCIAAWNLGLWVLRVETGVRRSLAVTGGLLLLPWVLFSFLPGIGPPGDQTAQENELRYLILLLNAMAVAGGLIFLKELVSEAGEEFYSTVGFAAILIATPLYLVWASIMIELAPWMERAITSEVPQWIRWIADLTDVLLFFGGVFTYVAAAAFAMSLSQIQWLGRRSTQTLVALSTVAVLCLVARGLRFPNPSALPWYGILGFVFGIPAIPWIVPCVFGVVLLRRAGNEPG